MFEMSFRLGAKLWRLGCMPRWLRNRVSEWRAPFALVSGVVKQTFTLARGRKFNGKIASITDVPVDDVPWRRIGMQPSTSQGSAA